MYIIIWAFCYPCLGRSNNVDIYNMEGHKRCIQITYRENCARFAGLNAKRIFKEAKEVE